jgi:hypothetical protein
MEYSLVKIYEDGNCFFRCLSVYIKNNLQECNRMKNGRCQSRRLFLKETNLADSLRDLLLCYLKENKEQYQNQNLDGCSLYLEDETLEEHIDRMSEDGEFAENLEVKLASDFLKVNINIWMFNDVVDLNLVDQKSGYQNTINLLLREDEHYDYLIMDDELPKIQNLETETKHDNTYHVIYPKTEKSYCIPYQMKTVAIKNGYLINTQKADIIKKLSKLKKDVVVKLDEDQWFVWDKSDQIKEIVEN